MPTKPKSRIRAAKVDDTLGESWHAEARARWERADENTTEYDAPALPAWSSPAHVTREQFGQFLLDRDTLVIHDARTAPEDCALDLIANGTWFHFWREVPDDAGDPCPVCIG